MSALDLCPRCGTLTVELVGMTDLVTPPAPLGRCTECGAEVVDITEPTPAAPVGALDHPWDALDPEDWGCVR